MKKAIVLDIDGVLLDTDFLYQEMHDKGIKKEDRFLYFYENCNSDRVKIKPQVRDFLAALTDDILIVLSTARDEKYHFETVCKLERSGIFFDELYMRPLGDLRSSAEVKREHFNQIMKRYEVVAFLDDELGNCEMARELGILALRVV